MQKIIELLRDLIENGPKETLYLGTGTYGVPPWANLDATRDHTASKPADNNVADCHELLDKSDRD